MEIRIFWMGMILTGRGGEDGFVYQALGGANQSLGAHGLSGPLNESLEQASKAINQPTHDTRERCSPALGFFFRLYIFPPSQNSGYTSRRSLSVFRATPNSQFPIGKPSLT